MYWYESNPELYQREVQAMKEFFPQFKLDKLIDGRLSWSGVVRGRGWFHEWRLQIVYGHNFPVSNEDNILIYISHPDLSKCLGEIPHLMSDAFGNILLNIRGSRNSACARLSFAIHWIFAFQIYMHGDISYEEFCAHQF